MFLPELQQYILHGQEETNIEYKDSMNWRNRVTQCKIIRAILAMSNHKNGGVIVVGVKQNGNVFTPVGLNKKNYNSFSDEVIREFVGSHSDPVARFTLVKDVMSVQNRTNGNMVLKKFCIIQVEESRELPTSAKKELLNNQSAPAVGDNICLRKGAIYIRPERNLASREIENQEEWRELLYRSIEKIRLRSTRLAYDTPIATSNIKTLTKERRASKKRSNDEKKFIEGLKKDKML